MRKRFNSVNERGCQRRPGEKRTIAGIQGRVSTQAALLISAARRITSRGKSALMHEASYIANRWLLFLQQRFEVEEELSSSRSEELFFSLWARCTRACEDDEFVTGRFLFGWASTLECCCELLCKRFWHHMWFSNAIDVTASGQTCDCAMPRWLFQFTPITVVYPIS